MRIKQRLDDFRVRELLADGFLAASGEHRVYRVTKRKLTSIEAARELASVAGVPAGDVALAGLKDRQGVTVQFMSIRRGREVNLRALDLTVESVGYSAEPLDSAHSLGNAFEITLRGLVQDELDALRDNVPLVRDCGVVNYFDEQRFGNLRHNQGWIAQQLMRGEREEALKRLVASLSDHDDRETRAFKLALLGAWGDWSQCREIAGRFGEYHSVFEHLKRNPDDFAGAFYHVASRLRLIHLYAFQSHLWNRAVADLMRKLVPEEERVALTGVEGALLYPSRPLALTTGSSFRLPGPGLEDVTEPTQRGLLEDALAREHMVADAFRIEGVSGFQLKGEERELVVQPRHLRVRPPEQDSENFGLFSVKVRFELPRGAYATLVVRRLLSSPRRAAGRDRGADRGQRDARSRTPHEGDTRPAGAEAPRSPYDAPERPRRAEHAEHDGGRWRRSAARGDDRGPRPGERRSEGRGRGLPQHSESGESLAPPRPPRSGEFRGERGGYERPGQGRGDGARGDFGQERPREWGGARGGDDRSRGPHGDSRGGSRGEWRGAPPGERGQDRGGRGQGNFGQRGYGQRGPDQRGYGQRGPAQHGYGQRGPDQRGYGQHGPDQRGPDQRGYDQRGYDQRGPDQRGPDQRGPDQRGPDQRGYDQRGPDQRGFDPRGRDQRGEHRGPQGGGWRPYRERTPGFSGPARDSGRPWQPADDRGRSRGERPWQGGGEERPARDPRAQGGGGWRGGPGGPGGFGGRGRFDARGGQGERGARGARGDFDRGRDVRGDARGEAPTARPERERRDDPDRAPGDS